MLMFKPQKYMFFFVPTTLSREPHFIWKPHFQYLISHLKFVFQVNLLNNNWKLNWKLSEQFKWVCLCVRCSFANHCVLCVFCSVQNKQFETIRIKKKPLHNIRNAIWNPHMPQQKEHRKTAILSQSFLRVCVYEFVFDSIRWNFTSKSVFPPTPPSLSPTFRLLSHTLRLWYFNCGFMVTK